MSIASGPLVVVDSQNSLTGLRSWVHPGTNGWTKQASPNQGLYSDTSDRRYLAEMGDSNDQICGIQYAQAAADAAVSGSVAWGKPRLATAGRLYVVFAK
jgi:hypothetical protein